MSEVTVVIPNWNGMRFLPDCLASLEAQTFRDFRVILIDTIDDALEMMLLPENLREENTEGTQAVQTPLAAAPVPAAAKG